MPKSFDDLTVEELKEKLAERDLPVSGTKDELIARLRGEGEKGAPPAARATHLTVNAEKFPELQDEAWAAGNPAQAQQLGG